jgi:ribose transport system permease protein
VGWYRVAGFALSGALASISGILVASRITIADVNMGRQLEFTILTAAVLGGASLFGGRGQVVNSIVSYFFLAMILNGLIMFGVEPHLQQVIVGAVLIVIVGLDTHFNREAR